MEFCPFLYLSFYSDKIPEGNTSVQLNTNLVYMSLWIVKPHLSCTSSINLVCNTYIFRYRPWKKHCWNYQTQTLLQSNIFLTNSKQRYSIVCLLILRFDIIADYLDFESSQFIQITLKDQPTFCIWNLCFL
jgi:hypothetical protein